MHGSIDNVLVHVVEVVAELFQRAWSHYIEQLGVEIGKLEIEQHSVVAGVRANVEVGLEVDRTALGDELLLERCEDDLSYGGQVSIRTRTYF